MRATALFFCLILFTAPALAQMPEGSAGEIALPVLTGQQKNTLLTIARESVTAVLEGREAREATVEPRLTEPQPMVVSLYVDGELRGRAWRLRNYEPIYLEARDLTFQAMAEPMVSDQPLTVSELSRVVISVGVLSNYTRAEDDRDVPPRSAVIIYSGFKEWMAMPGDVVSGKAADLLSYACEQAGLRPNIWLLPQTTIFSAQVEEMREGPGAL